MRRLRPLLLLLLLPTLARPADPPFAPGEQIDLSVDFLHLHAGQVRIAIGQPEGAVWPIVCQARTAGAAGWLDIREHLVSLWDAEARQSRGAILNSIEIGDRHTDRYRFDRALGQARVEILRKGQLQSRVHDVPADVQDLASALLRLRLAPLAPGLHVEVPVFSGTKAFTLRADVTGTETIEVPAGRFAALRVRVQLGFDDRFRTARDAVVWFTDDARHVPLRMTADFAVGTVTAALTAYRPGTTYASGG